MVGYGHEYTIPFDVFSLLIVLANIVTVHSFRVQRSGLRTKKALNTRSPR
jgi:hypothetical protein